MQPKRALPASAVPCPALPRSRRQRGRLCPRRRYRRCPCPRRCLLPCRRHSRCLLACYCLYPHRCRLPRCCGLSKVRPRAAAVSCRDRGHRRRAARKGRRARVGARVAPTQRGQQVKVVATDEKGGVGGGQGEVEAHQHEGTVVAVPNAVVNPDAVVVLRGARRCTL